VTIRTATAFIMLLAAVQPAATARDPAADFLVRLFTKVCIANLGQPIKVREWAQEHHLGQIQNPAAVHGMPLTSVAGGLRKAGSLSARFGS
jgi:hypothetical protein